MEVLECQGCNQILYSTTDKTCPLCGCTDLQTPKKKWGFKYAKELKPKVKK